MHTSSHLFVLYIILGIVALIAAFVVWVYRAAKKQQQERRRLIQEFGFQEAPERTRDLTERMKTLHHHWTEHHGLDGVKRKSEWGYELLLFDLQDSSGDSTHTESDQGVLIAPDLKLPRFTMFPKMQGTGLVAAMTNKALGWIASRFAVQATFPDAPEFDAKYLVWGDDEAALRECFSPARLARLAETEELQAEGSGDALLFSRVPFHRVKQTYEEKLREILQNAKLLFEIFKT